MEYDNTNSGAVFPNKDGSWSGPFHLDSQEINASVLITADKHLEVHNRLKSGAPGKKVLARSPRPINRLNNPTGPAGVAQLPIGGHLVPVVLWRMDSSKGTPMYQVKPDKYVPAEEPF